MTMVDDAIAQGKAEILEDISSGVVPVSISCFSELHDYVDANEYGGLTGSEFSLDEMNSVQEALDEWLRSGALRKSR